MRTDRGTDILLAVPAHNEGAILGTNIPRLLEVCKRTLGRWSWRIIIADNGSTDATEEIGRRMQSTHRGVKYMRLDDAGKGRAIRAAWRSGKSRVYGFTDADLPADLSVLAEMVESVLGRWDVCAASRRLPGSRTERPMTDKLISRSLSLLVRSAFRSKLTDTACGLKVVNERVARQILPRVKNQKWAFDTELLLLAEKAGYTIREVPVHWSEPRTGGRPRLARSVPIMLDYVVALADLRRRKR